MTPSGDSPVLRFGVVGVVNTLAGLAVIYAASGWLGMGDVAANATGYGVGMLLGFLSHKLWTFSHTGSAMPALLRFVATLSLAYVLNLATVLGLLQVGVDPYLAQALGVGPYAICCYLGSRHFVFPPRAPDALKGA